MLTTSPPASVAMLMLTAMAKGTQARARQAGLPKRHFDREGFLLKAVFPDIDKYLIDQPTVAMLNFAWNWDGQATVIDLVDILNAAPLAADRSAWSLKDCSKAIQFQAPLFLDPGTPSDQPLTCKTLVAHAIYMVETEAEARTIPIALMEAQQTGGRRAFQAAFDKVKDRFRPILHLLLIPEEGTPVTCSAHTLTKSSTFGSLTAEVESRTFHRLDKDAVRKVIHALSLAGSRCKSC